MGDNRQIRVSYRAHALDNSPPSAVTTNWGGLVQSLCAPPRALRGPAQSKKSVPLIVPAVFDGRGKTDENVTAVTLAFLDFDQGYDTAALQRLLESLAGLRYLIYTSYSNTRDPWKFRLVVDLDRDLSPAEFPQFWRAWSARFDPPPDLTCHNPSRGYFLPATPRLEAFWSYAQPGAPLPVDRVIASAPSGAGLKAPDLSQAVSEAVTALDLAQHGKKLARAQREDKRQLGAWLRKIADGRPYADPHTRHNTRLRVTLELDKAFPLAHPETLAELLRESHEQMADEEFDPDPEHASTIKQIEGARRKRLARAERHKADKLDEQQTAIRELLGRTEPYSDAELGEFATAQGVSLAAWKSRWIVQHGRSAYLWVGHSYRGPVGLDALVTAAKRWLAPALARPDVTGVSLTKQTQAGALVRKTREDLLAQYATVVTRVAYDLASSVTKLDTCSDELVLAACPSLNRAPRYSERVAKWLELLGGDQHQDLLRWLRWLRDLSHGHACLYLEGGGGTGKSLFGQALARLWSRDGATPAVAVAGNFQDLLLGCPLVFADEHMPPEWSGNTGGARFRDFLGSSVHPLNRKGLPAVLIRGYARVVAAANNERLMQMRETLTKADRAAIQERIFHIHVHADARRYLELLRKQDASATAAIVQGELAEHVLWIERNLELPRTGRFGVAGTRSRVHDVLKWAQAVNSGVGEWLVAYLTDPERWESAQRNRASRAPLLRFFDGQFLANARAFRTEGDWQVYVHNPRFVPTHPALAKALEEWGMGTQRVEDVDYVVVDLNALRDFALYQKTCTEHEFDRAVQALFHRSGFQLVG